jgi:hypothetical protein
MYLGGQFITAPAGTLNQYAFLPSQNYKKMEV